NVFFALAPTQLPARIPKKPDRDETINGTPECPLQWNRCRTKGLHIRDQPRFGRSFGFFLIGLFWKTLRGDGPTDSFSSLKCDGVGRFSDKGSLSRVKNTHANGRNRKLPFSPRNQENAKFFKARSRAKKARFILLIIEFQTFWIRDRRKINEFRV